MSKVDRCPTTSRNGRNLSVLLLHRVRYRISCQDSMVRKTRQWAGGQNIGFGTSTRVPLKNKMF